MLKEVQSRWSKVQTWPKMIRLMLIFLTFQAVKPDRRVVPMFLLDYNNVMGNTHAESNPFTKLNTSEFSNLVDEAISKSEVIVIFIEDHLSTEDITMRDTIGTPFYHLREGLQETKVKYFPSVTEPYKLLHKIFRPHNFNVLRLNSGTNLHLDKSFQYFYVYFQDGQNETRSEKLRKHDIIMREVFLKLRQRYHGAIVAFYTGKTNPVQMEKPVNMPLSPLKSIKKPGVKIPTDGAIFRFVDVYLKSPARSAMYTRTPQVSGEEWTPTSLETKFSYPEFEVEFKFSYRRDGWTLDTACLIEGEEVVGQTVTNFGAPWGMGYYCAEPLTIHNKRDHSYFVISEYQIQPRKMPILRRGFDSSPPNGAFGDAVNCSPYFNIPILASLMVTVICASILLYGIVSLYSINSNDRYEDPHGKPMIIAAEL